jgi:peptidoglycan/LPS O-acetylase OafA/YrhL
MALSPLPFPSQGRMNRLDGIRAFAFAAVFIFHSGASGNLIDLGWVGVPLFFVLSGFLITGILRKQRQAPTFWRNFYIKRAVRILPPVLLAFGIAAAFIPIPWREVGWWDALFAANIAEVLHPYESKGLAVLWSLAVEEQFYLLWPFAIRFMSRKSLIRLLVTVLICEPLIRGIATPFLSSQIPIYFLTPFQLDGLGVGALLAILLESPTAMERIKHWSGVMVTASAILVVGLNYDTAFRREAHTIAFNSVGYSLIVFFSVSLISFVVLHEQSVLSRFLSWKIFVKVGLMSYGLYLFHSIGIDIAREVGLSHGTWHPIRAALCALPFVVALSWLSFNFYERPFIALGVRWTTPRQGTVRAMPVLNRVRLMNAAPAVKSSGSAS